MFLLAGSELLCWSVAIVLNTITFKEEWLQMCASSECKLIAYLLFIGRKLAVDANLTLYQFLTAVRLSKGGGALCNNAGETTRFVIHSQTAI